MGEPWCFTPAEIAGLTDSQIVDRYFAPRDEKGQLIQPASINNPVENNAIPEREAFIAEAVAMFGQDAEHWAKVYDENLKLIEANRHGAESG